MEILRGVTGLADLDIFFAGELQEAFDARAGVFRTLAFIAMGQQQDQAGGEIPFVFGSADKLIDDDLRAVDEVAELSFPEDQSFGVVAAETIFKTDAGGFGERRIVNFAKRAVIGADVRKMRERHVFRFVLGVDQRSVTLIEGAALGVLSGEADRSAIPQQGTKGEGDVRRTDARKRRHRDSGARAVARGCVARLRDRRRAARGVLRFLDGHENPLERARDRR